MKRKEREAQAAVFAPCLIFPRTGKENTAQVLEVVRIRAEELGIKHIVVATASGATGLMAARIFKGRNVVAVTHSTGFLKPGHQELKPQMRRKLEDAGAKVLTCQHAFGGLGRAVRKKLGTYELDEIIATTLRIFGEGTKVAVEISLMAADAGLIPASEPCLAIGGTNEGADTALLLKPSNAQTFFDVRIVEIVAKPRLAASTSNE